MMHKKIILLIVAAVCAFASVLPPAGLYAAEKRSSPKTESGKESTEPVPYSDDEFPQWAKDLRHAEIVGFGSLPFVAIGVTTGYGLYQYSSGEKDSFPNPFDKDNGFSQEEILMVVGASVGISAVLGITDYIISYSKRKKARQLREQQEAENRENVTVVTPEEAGAMLRKNGGSRRTRPVSE